MKLSNPASGARSDYLMWFRKEQLLTVTWAGDPYKPMEGNDPLQLSPRRSDAALLRKCPVRPHFAMLWQPLGPSPTGCP